ncbi:AMP-binding protein [Porticoccaceae bacterium]|nr:AMP-binding protein [Porticoccaceae bacterium]
MDNLRSLATDLETFKDTHVVAKTLAGKNILWADLCQRVAYWQAEIEGISTSRIGLYHSNPVEFLAALLAIWRQGKTAVIPANTLDEMVAAVKTKTSVLIGEFGGDNVRFGDTSCDQDLAESALILFTSGSSGQPKAVPKSFVQLDAELEMLEERWGVSVCGSVFAGTVSHHHMYGLPFRLLWPLVHGRPFLDRDIVYLEQILQRKAQSFTLIASPAHLENLPDSLDWSLFSQTVGAVFSAGAALSPVAARQFFKVTDISVEEVYGSTESGAVAWRNQLQSELWQPLERVRVKAEDGKLCIRSAAVNDQQWLITDDLCTVAKDGRFSLNGRSDRIIKVGGKRVSATAIEATLESHSWVDRARVTLPQNKKSRVSAVVQLLPEGNAQLVDLGKRHVCQALSAILERNIDVVARPRYWRFVTKLPTNSQGKTTALELDALFTGGPRGHLPLIVDTIRHPDTSVSMKLIIPDSLITLEGHFPGMPVLPGVVQIGWAIRFGTELFGRLGDFRRLEKLKFQGIIRPNERIALQLSWDSKRRCLAFRYSSSDNIRSSGRVVFAGAPTFE